MAVSAGVLTSSKPHPQGVQTPLLRGIETSDPFTMPAVANAFIFPFARFSSGMIYVDKACTITWYVTSTRTGAVSQAYDDASTPVALTQSPGGAGWYALPAKLFGAPFIAPTTATGTVTAILVLKK